MLKDTLFFIVIFFTNIIQGITGFAGTVLAMPPSILLQGIDTAKVILNILGIIASVWIVIISLKDLNKKEFIKIMLIMFSGLILGNYIYLVLPLPILLKIYAIFIVLISLKGLYIKQEKKLKEYILVTILLVAGIFHGMFVSGGPLLIIYATQKFRDKSEFRVTISAVWIILNSFLLYNHYIMGLLNKENIQKLYMSIPALLVGMMIGNILHKKMSQQLFLLITYILLLISGIMLLI